MNYHHLSMVVLPTTCHEEARISQAALTDLAFMGVAREKRANAHGTAFAICNCYQQRL